MTPQEAVKFMSQIKCEPFVIQIFIEANGVSSVYDHVELRAIMPTHKDVNIPNSGPGKVLERIKLTLDYPFSEKACIDLVYELLTDMATHEIKEWFTVKGVRTMDPHRGHYEKEEQ